MARPRKHEGETVTLSARVPVEIKEAFDQYVAQLNARLPYGHVTASEALVELVKRAVGMGGSGAPSRTHPAGILEASSGVSSGNLSPLPVRAVPQASTARKPPKGGRSLSDAEIARVLELRGQGLSQGKIADELGVSQSGISNVLRKYGGGDDARRE